MESADPQVEKLFPEEALSIPAPVSSSFCVPYTTQFIIFKKNFVWTDGVYKVKDIKGNLLFKIDRSSALCCNLVVYDHDGSVVMSLRRKIFSFVDTWNAYRGKKSSKSEDRLFTMSRSSLIQWKPHFTIWLPGKGNDEFTLSSDFFGTHYKIRHNGVIIAEAVQKWVLCFKKEMAVTVKPGVDQAFVAALLVIKRQIVPHKQIEVEVGGD
ncbi:hypothetical protein AXG93_1528s1100 [Marchantia polymorpha subsp. ruderalis]|uniref:Tubby C-terminal domain-containing protein n=1 Tax=Marchantia polymorpha subsp. ruderalis TaxID=1480154 RepID=A0A176VTY2_MARPO|nr:hypothetical protein AXG93_1528s1100 [Marchantia polymorpha subsp. ruderalis]